jgi:hypothetical protein
MRLGKIAIIGLGMALASPAWAQVTPSVVQSSPRKVEFPGYAIGGAVQLFDISGNVIGTSANPLVVNCNSGCTGGGGSSNITQFGGNNVVTGIGASGAGIPRVSLSNDSTVQANAGTNLNTSSLALEAGGNLATLVTDSGAPGATACATDTSSCNFNQLFQRIAQRLSTINTTLGTPMQATGGTIQATNFPATVDTNTGNAGASTPRVALATNNPAIAAWGHIATGAAPPSGATYVGANSGGATGGHVAGLITCNSHVFKHITTATDTLAVQGVTSQTVYICGWRSRAAGVATWYLENTASTNANCSSTLTQITGVATEAANTGEDLLAPFWTGLSNTSGNGLCINSTGTGGVDVDIWYAQF